MQNYRMILEFFKAHEAYQFRNRVIQFKNKLMPIKLRNNYLQIELADRSLIMFKTKKGAFNDLITDLVEQCEGLYNDAQIRQTLIIKKPYK